MLASKRVGAIIAVVGLLLFAVLCVGTLLFGEKTAVKATVRTLGGFSAHAGQTDLLKWFSAIAPCKPRVVLTHGEDGPRRALAQQIQQRFKLKATLPQLGDTIEL